MEGDRRQLAAVMLTDMVGYSALTQRDESLALRLARDLDEVVRLHVERSGGRVVKSLGDGALLEFSNALDAVNCAVEIQRSVRDKQWDAESAVELRIGVHLGDIVHRDDDVFGDAVNIVARVEPHADHGGICVTRQVFDQVHNKLTLPLVSIGAPRLKNIEVGIELFRVVLDDSTADVRARTGARTSRSELRIVILPFTNISPDPNDEYFADGMTEEVIERLAHVTGLRVIARTTAMHYKSTTATALEIGRALDVGMVLQCSVRKAGSQLRITAQLIDTASEEHLWSSRYDREMDDVFAIQDDISNQIATAISEHVSRPNEIIELVSMNSGGDTKDMGAYTAFLQCREVLRRRGGSDSLRQARDRLLAILEKDPEFARARVCLAEIYDVLAGEGYEPYEVGMQRAREELSLALSQDDTSAEGHSELAALLLGEDDPVGAEREARRAIDLNPNYSDPYRWLAQIAAGKGQPDAAVTYLEEAYRIDPLDVNIMSFLVRMLFYSGRIEQFLELANRVQAMSPFRVHQYRAEYCLSERDLSRAELEIAAMRQVRPDNVYVIMLSGILAALRGEEVAARDHATALKSERAASPVRVFAAGFIYCTLGEYDAFFAAMDECLAMNSLPLLELMYSPLYAAAHLDPRYADLLRRQQEVQGAVGPESRRP